MDKGSVVQFAAVSTQVVESLGHYVDPAATIKDPGSELERFIASHRYDPSTMLALQQMVTDVRNEAVGYGSLGNVPADMQANVRNQMYVTSETMRLLPQVRSEDVRERHQSPDRV